MALLQTTQVGRDINRHYFSAAEVRQSLQKPVVRKLLELIRLRNQHPAFDGEFQVLTSPAHALSLRWQAAEHFAQFLQALTSLGKGFRLAWIGIDDKVELA